MELFQIEQNCLIVTDDLGPESVDQFQAMCAALANLESEEVIIDLSAVSYIGSRYFGEMIAAQDQLAGIQKKLIVRARRNVIDVMELLGLLEFLRVEEV